MGILYVNVYITRIFWNFSCNVTCLTIFFLHENIHVYLDPFIDWINKNQLLLLLLLSFTHEICKYINDRLALMNGKSHGHGKIVCLFVFFPYFWIWHFWIWWSKFWFLYTFIIIICVIHPVKTTVNEINQSKLFSDYDLQFYL